MQQDTPHESSQAEEQVGELSLGVIERALDAARSRRKEIEAQSKELERAAALALQEESLLADLVAIRRGKSDVNRGLATVRYVGPAAAERVQSSHPVVDEVLNILEQEARPVHISQVMRVLRDRQIDIPGSGTQANVISHLARDGRISRPSRGMYALAASDLAHEERKPEKASRKRERE